MADNLSYLYTIGGYATLFAAGYVIYQVSIQKNRKRAGPPPSVKITKSSQPEARKDDKKKKQQRMESFASEAQGPSKTAVQAKVEPETNNWLSNTQEKSRDDDADNLKFARQLAKAQEGTKFANKAEGGKKQREKSVKQSRANQVAAAAEEKESAPSSTNGADADDDQSPIASPEVVPAVAGDVSDMLEPAPARPAVLRVTDAAPKQQKQKAAKAPEPVETKKQRQNRKKAEAAKAAREESEKERKVLEEKQRRTARVAEGRAAKDGSEFMAANGNKSAWKEGAPNSSNGSGAAAKTNGFHQPLDTFEPSTTAAAKPAEKNWISSLPSEEEQIQMLKSDEDEWSTVKTKSSKKAAKNESPIDSGDDKPSRAAAQPQPVATNNKAPKAAQSFGSFSALSTKDEPADEEEDVEEEWDV